MGARGNGKGGRNTRQARKRRGMNPRHTPFQQPQARCSGQVPKVRYPDQASAMAALQNAQSHATPRRVETRVYECPICHGWHLTGQAPKSPGARLAQGLPAYEA